MKKKKRNLNPFPTEDAIESVSEKQVKKETASKLKLNKMTLKEHWEANKEVYGIK